MQTAGIWLQAVSAMALVFLTTWAVFFSDVGELATLLLQSELLETKQHIQAIQQEKKNLEIQKIKLQEQQNELAKERDEHISRVVRDRLADIWLLGAKTLAINKQIAKLGQQLLYDAEKIKLYRNLEHSNDIIKLQMDWHRVFPEHGKIYNEKRSEWGDIVIDRDVIWRCSKDNVNLSNIYEEIEFDTQGTEPGTKQRLELVNKRQQKINIEYHQRRIEYHLSCFKEWERSFRERIQFSDNQTSLTIRDFAEWILQWLTLNEVSEAVTSRIRDKLTNEIDANRQLGSLVIQLRLSKNVSLMEISERAKEIEANIILARDWLDEATKDRFVVQMN